MTYIAAWKYRRNIYMVTDSAITRSRKIKAPAISTTGEKHIAEDDFSVNEECYKIFQLENDCIVAIAGDVKNAVMFIDGLRRRTNKSDRLDYFYQNYKGLSNRKFEAIIGFRIENSVRLFSLNCIAKPEFQEKTSFVTRGSGASTFALQTQNLITAISQKEYFPSERLAFFVTGHQLFSLTSDVFHQGVGGIHNGVRLSKHGVSWNRDVAYIFYSDKTSFDEDNMEISEDSLIVFAYNRDGMLYVKSPFPLPQGTNLLVPSCKLKPRSQRLKDVSDWYQEYYDVIREMVYEKRKKVKYLAFIYRTPQRKAAVGLMHLSKDTLSHTALEYAGNGWFDLRTQVGTLKEVLVNTTDQNLVCNLIKR